MRTTQKAAPLVAIGVAGLLGLAAQLAWARLRALPRPRLRRAALVAAPVGLAALIALAALPLVRGTAIEKQLTWKRIPSAWTDVGAGPRPRRCRATRARWCCPGQIFANYTWGGTTDAILPRVTDTPGRGALRDARTATRTRPTCSGPSTGWSPRGGCCPASCCRCCA